MYFYFLIPLVMKSNCRYGITCTITYVFLSVFLANAQVGIGTTTPQAALDISSVNSGILIPRLTTAQRDAIASPTDGMMIYNTDEHVFQYYIPAINNAATALWKSVTRAPSVKYVSSPSTLSGDLSDAAGPIEVPIFNFPSWNDDTDLFGPVSGQTSITIAEPGRYRITFNGFFEVTAGSSAVVQIFANTSVASSAAATLTNTGAVSGSFSVNFTEILQLSGTNTSLSFRVREIDPGSDVRLVNSPFGGATFSGVIIEKIN
ncbi:hypothetical protein [Ascidiimonas aurantiaca]|uniref:hypothetical protein n=1 Tax=Ascidiimonas aurantiaca TaxID=1685432 RepID=UPI0030EBD2F6